MIDATAIDDDEGCLLAIFLIVYGVVDGSYTWVAGWRLLVVILPDHGQMIL